MVLISLTFHTRWVTPYSSVTSISGAVRAGEQDLFRGERRVRIEHEDLPEVGPRGAQQVQPVRLRLGKRLLVAENHLLAVIAYLAQGDKGAALMDFSIAAGHGEPLRVSEDAGVFFLGQNPHAAPVGEIARRAGVDVVAPRFVKEFGQPQDDADQVV